MYRELIRLIVIFFLVLLCYLIYSFFSPFFEKLYSPDISYILFVLLFLGIGYLLGGYVGYHADRTANLLEQSLEKVPAIDFIVIVFGLMVGLLVAALISLPLFVSPFSFSYPLIFLIFFFFGAGGVFISWRKRVEFKSFVGDTKQDVNETKVKILDTSAVVDGRVADLRELGILEGELVLPSFVLKEIHSLADSFDDLKRARGRRALEVLERLKLQGGLIIEAKDYPHIESVDDKLINLAAEISGTIVTTDYGLSKVASVAGRLVLNLNEVAVALKQVYLPGEKVKIKVVKEGKERGQGAGYLEDGTLVVVEDGKRFIGKEVEVIVTGLIQTSSGKIVFTKLAEGSKWLEQ